MYEAVLCGNSGEPLGEDAVLLRNDASEFTFVELEALLHLKMRDDPPLSVHEGGERSNNDDGGVGVDNGNEMAAKCVKRKQDVLFCSSGDERQCLSLRAFLTREGLVCGTDSMADEVLGTLQLHVENRALRDTSLVECFLNLTHLYMQHNHIASLEGISLLAQLTVLVVHHNAVETLRPLAGLGALMFLDASFNSIALLDPFSDLPRESLRYLSLLANPCCRSVSAVDVERDEYRKGILESCPLLEMLDDVSLQLHLSSSDAEDEEEGNVGGAVMPSGTPRGLPFAERCRSAASSRLCQLMAMSDATPPNLSRAASPRSSPEVDGSTTTARLCEQFMHRSGSIRRLADDHAFGLPDQDHGLVGLEGNGFGSDGDNAGGSGVLPAALLQERETKLRLYSDIHFAVDMDKVRAQQILGSAWEDVDKVVRTRQALVAHRRERMAMERQQPSNAYTESLALLKKEHHVTDLSNYRN